MSQPLVYLAEDDPEIRHLTSAALAREGFRVETAECGVALWALLDAAEPDVLVLDIMMPGEDGLSICRRWPQRSRAPVILASARNEDLDRIIGLEIGADDYVPKPYNPRELAARIRALLRRASPRGDAAAINSGAFLFDGWRLDLGSRGLTDPTGDRVEITPAEFDVLTTLLGAAQRVVSRDQLMDALHGRAADAFDRSIDLHVSRLRKKLRDDPREPRFIRTVRNGGYMFSAPARKA